MITGSEWSTKEVSNHEKMDDSTSSTMLLRQLTVLKE
jgi:hypothetical protein